jgi:hypothetical protein
MKMFQMVMQPRTTAPSPSPSSGLSPLGTVTTDDELALGVGGSGHGLAHAGRGRRKRERLSLKAAAPSTSSSLWAPQEERSRSAAHPLRRLSTGPQPQCGSKGHYHRNSVQLRYFTILTNGYEV